MDHDDFDAAIGRAWADHADDPAGVATRLPALRQLATGEAELERWIGLARHLYGVHFGAWDDGTDVLLALRAHPAYRESASSGAALRRALASLAVAAGGAAHGFEASDQIRVQAMAAENLCDHDVRRAAQSLRQALALGERAALPDADPAHRMLASAANALACTLEEKPDRTADDRAAMIDAAQAARRYWALAGTWLEVERAEYRLAITYTRAGELARARTHAQHCLDIIDANQGAALERFFGWEALGTVARAAGDADEYARALARARVEFEQIDVDDRGWCGAELDKLAASTSPV